jgi:pimeloyl-ACP methyl ester carboxylesterase
MALALAIHVNKECFRMHEKQLITCTADMIWITVKLYSLDGR